MHSHCFATKSRQGCTDSSSRPGQNVWSTHLLTIKFASDWDSIMREGSTSTNSPIELPCHISTCVLPGIIACVVLHYVDLCLSTCLEVWKLCLLCPGHGLTDRQLQAEVGTFIMGGFETTAHTLSFTLFCIATSPGVQEKIADELRDMGLLNADGSLGRPIQAEDLNLLSYLSNVIKESMRMFPVVAGFPR